MFDLIDMDDIGVEKYFTPKELTDSMKFLDDCSSGYFELFGDDNFSEKAIYDFVFLGTYIGGKYGDSGDECVCISEYFDQEEIAEKFFTKYIVHPLLHVKMKLITGNKLEFHVKCTTT